MIITIVSTKPNTSPIAKFCDKLGETLDAVPSAFDNIETLSISMIFGISLLNTLTISFAMRSASACYDFQHLHLKFVSQLVL